MQTIDTNKVTRSRDHRLKCAGGSGAGFAAISPRDTAPDLTSFRIEFFTSVLFCWPAMTLKFENFESTLKKFYMVMPGSSDLLRNVTKFRIDYILERWGVYAKLSGWDRAARSGNVLGIWIEKTYRTIFWEKISRAEIFRCYEMLRKFREIPSCQDYYEAGDACRDFENDSENYTSGQLLCELLISKLCHPLTSC